MTVYLHLKLRLTHLIVAFQGYFKTLRMEVNEHNIGVTLVCPGPVQTDVVANAFTEDVNKVIDHW